MESYYCIPLLLGSKEDIGILRVELEGLADIRPTQGARWKREVLGGIGIGIRIGLGLGIGGCE